MTLAVQSDNPGALSVVLDALLKNPKAWLLFAILGPVAVLGFRDAAREWDRRQWERWFLRVVIVLTIGTCLIAGAFLLPPLVTPYSRAAGVTLFFGLLVSGMIWGISGLVEALFALQSGKPFPHLYDPSTRPWLIALTVILCGGMLVGSLGAELFGASVVRGFLLVLGIGSFLLGALAPSSFWDSDYRIVRMQAFLGPTGARLFYAGLGLALALAAFVAPASMLRK